VGFGIFGTILMMTMERTREFGMLISIGMRRSVLTGVVIIESILLSCIGVLTGVIFSFPIILYFHFNPIKMSGDVAEMTRQYGFEAVMPFSLDPAIFLYQALIVLVIALVAAVYPMVSVARMNPARALREG
jgi:ABC-type antimicrobial peptide transport system permease subunit